MPDGRLSRAAAGANARTRTSVLLVSVLGVLLTACSGSSGKEDRGAASGAELPSTVAPTPDAKIRTLTARQWQRMRDAGMVRPECPIQKRSELRVVVINHYDFSGDIRRGTLVVNADVAGSIARIFTKLFDGEFPIRRMTPVEAFDGDTSASLRADNTSAYNCRRADQINAPFTDSPHANGRAIDINPRENPWMDLRCNCWTPGAEYAKRIERPGGIIKGGLVWRLFRNEGWIWQNIDVPDYMHFDTGYPSAPFTG